jgi:UDP-glucose 4-epimerase
MEREAEKPVILVTGGTGYIGSHTVVSLGDAGYYPIIMDNLSNSSPGVLERIAAIMGRRPPFYQADLRDRKALDQIFQDYPVAAVIHLAGFKAVGESVAEPLRYYENNIDGALALFSLMTTRGVKRLIFSSSATVYGDPPTVPIDETFPLAPTSPYGRTKLMIEQILRDLAVADPDWRITFLRYFNPVGAHASGLIGEDPRGIPNNLMPYISQVAVGRRERLHVFGDDYPTPDGTGVRDYIHVMDLAEGHVAALQELESASSPRVGSAPLIINLGTGRGYSVFELLRAFEKASGRTIPYRITIRRPGDIATCYADPRLAKTLLGWEARRTLDDMCADTWHWQSSNPQGLKNLP